MNTEKNEAPSLRTDVILSQISWIGEKLSKMLVSWLHHQHPVVSPYHVLGMGVLIPEYLDRATVGQLRDRSGGPITSRCA